MMEDIHDIRPPVMVGMDPELVKLCIWIALGLGLALILFLVVRRLLKKRETGSQTPTVPVIPPYETALKALDRLAVTPAEDSISAAKTFYFELGRIIKAYTGATWGFNCLEMTTQELARQLRAVDDLPGSIKSDIVLFQDICDPFRYAPEPVLERTRMVEDLGQGRELIEAMEAAKKAARQGADDVDEKGEGR